MDLGRRASYEGQSVRWLVRLVNVAAAVVAVVAVVVDMYSAAGQAPGYCEESSQSWAFLGSKCSWKKRPSVCCCVPDQNWTRVDASAAEKMELGWSTVAWLEEPG